ncbi:MAG: S1C family serine protease, partial [Candidatus Binatia bacterium]
MFIGVMIGAGVPLVHAEPNLVRLFADANPAVVVVSAYSESGTPLSQGSGVIIESSGTVVTNDHVISGASVVVVRRPRADPVFATRVIAASDDSDLALLKIPGAALPSLTLARAHSAKVGMHVIAIGSPLGLENTISEGIISGIRDG